MQFAVCTPALPLSVLQARPRADCWLRLVLQNRGKDRWGRAHLLEKYGDHFVQLGTPSTLAEGKAAQGHGMRFKEYIRLMDWYDDAVAKGVTLLDSTEGR